jgi:hypothetical protein
MEHVVHGILISLYRFIQRLLALVWAALARMADVRWFMNVGSSLAACLGSYCSKNR